MQHVFFFFNDTATTEIYTLSLHDALPISADPAGGAGRRLRRDRARERGADRRDQHSDHRSWAAGRGPFWPDRKSTRLNSSHANISYAVFCLKKKKNKHILSSISNISTILF